MKRKPEGENARARTGVRNQAFSSPTTEEPKATTLASGAQQNTPRFPHTGDEAKPRWANAECLGRSPEPKANQKNRGKLEHKKISGDKYSDVLEVHLISPFLTILLKHSG